MTKEFRVVGGSSYSGNTFKDLMDDLAWIIAEIKKDNEKIQQNVSKFGVHNLSVDFRATMQETISLFNLVGECEEYLPDMRKKNIAAFHIEKLRDIAAKSVELDRDIGKTYKDGEGPDFYARDWWEKFSPEQIQFLSLEIYGAARDDLVMLRDFGSITNELQKYAATYLKKNVESSRESLPPARSSAEVEQRTALFPDLPGDLKWEEVTIRFLNRQEVIVDAREKRFQSTYAFMGFEDNKRKLPNKQWELLEALALNKGEFSWNNVRSLPLKDINAVKKRKQLLANCLQSCFGLEADPFYPYREEKAYKIKLSLIPERNLEEEVGPEDNSEIEQYRKEQAPEV